MGNSLVEEQKRGIQAKEQETPLPRDCETPCFYKETQQNGFNLPRDQSRLMTENKKNGRASRDVSPKKNVDDEDFYENSSDIQKFGSQLDTLPFNST
jgi:predicted 2-oxoglutarate/Fe(II)-dependent dioxygenase YbiX